jgi:16S rRNA G527 N7-methylase RsmG
VFGVSSFPRREIAIVEEEAKKWRSMEQVRAHLARTDTELLEAAHRLLDPRTDDEFGMDVVRAVANARTLVGDALETIRARLWE